MSMKSSWISAGTSTLNGPGIVDRAYGGLKTAWAALVAGSQTIPFGDNGNLFRVLAAQIAASRRRS
jgi:hypothetical protein